MGIHSPSSRNFIRLENILIIGNGGRENSLAWAKDRRQGRDLKGPKDPNESADNILVHPDVRRMLLESKVNNEGCRALAAWTGILLDQMHSDDPEEAEYASSLVALFTPIVKAHFTDVACETASTCMQVMGGAGYCTESVSYTHLTLPTICSV